jgi:methionyl-tRNA formyltransferase
VRIALFASDVVGLRVAEFLGRHGEAPACLVVDGVDPKGLNERIVAASGLRTEQVIATCRSASQELSQKLAQFKPDLCLLAWWPYLLDEPTLKTPTLGSLNFHPSLLPHGRGKAPNFWSLVEGTPFGVTIHWVDAGIDSGDIAFQREISVAWEDTGASLYRRALENMFDLFVDSYPRIATGDIPRVPQPAARCHYQRELDEASRIDPDCSYTGRELLNLLRARTFPPHPGAWFEEQGVRYEVRVDIRRMGDSARRNAA